jgi:hypothetical protein
MNLNVLSIHVMLSHSGYWVGNDALRAQLTAHPVGAALLSEVARAHERLAGQAERRRQVARELARLTALLASLDLTHDNMARGIHAALDALIITTADPDASARYQRLRGLLFPEGLGIVSRSYMYEAGAITALEARMSEADVAELAAIQVGPQTLADWYRAWIAAGQELGRNVHAREVLLTRTGRGGSAATTVDQRSARLDWVNTVQTFLRALDLMQLSPETREHLLSSLETSIAQALRQRAQNPGDELPGDDSPADELPADELPEAPPPADASPADTPGDGTPPPAPGPSRAPATLLAASPPASAAAARPGTAGTAGELARAAPEPGAPRRMHVGTS